MKHVVLLVDQKARDLASVLLIGEYLKDFGVRVTYCNKHNMLATVEQANADVVVLSCSEAQYYELARHIAPRSQIVLMTQEGACATKEATVLRHTLKGTGLPVYVDGLSRVYLWSEVSRKWLAEEHVYPDEIVRVVGTSRLDPYRQLERHPHDPDRRIRVGIANRGFAVNPSARRNPIEEIDATRARSGGHRAYIDAGREWEDWIWHNMASLRVNLDLIDRLDSTRKYEIVLRPDPYEDFTSYRFLERKYPSFSINVDPLLCNFIDRIDVLVTEFSTTGTEALMVAKPVISTHKLLGPRLLKHTRLPHHVDPEHMRFYWQPADDAEFMRMVDEAAAGTIPYSPEREAATAYLKRVYGWASDAPSAAWVIARDLAELCETPKPAQLAQLHRREYVEHPVIQHLSKRFRLPRWVIRKFVLRPVVADCLSVVRAARRRNLAIHMRMNFYRWQRAERQRIGRVFDRLKARDARILSASR